uniref:Uncharacterized protein n=1 Tax=Panagrolaimus sp. JU765 TaxID=591449 RepID=A0AC34QT96_9BILA
MLALMIFFSCCQNIVDAIRDARIFFKKDVNEADLVVEATRAYVESHLAEALACQLAEHQMLQKRRDSFDGKEI